MTSLDKNTLIIGIILALMMLIMPVAGATTELQIVKYASDGETVLNETTVSYEWIETNLPVLGDGVTHYYHQGPVFDDPWNDAEDLNLKDQGAVKGSDVKDLCEIIGGASPGDIIKIKANDGFSKNFPYANIYTPESRQGPIGITWYLDGDGYVPGYSSGMKLIFFADTSVNPDGLNVFGVSDMKETFPEEYWYYYEAGIPTTTGLSVKYVSRIEIMSNEEPPAGLVTLFDGELDLQDKTFSLEATSGTSYDVERLTPLGALNATDLDLTVNDKSFGTKGILLLDGINEYLYDKTAGTTWICTVNGQTLDDYGSPDTDGFNIYELKDGDIVEFYFGVKPVTPETATADIRIEVSVGGGTTPEDWTLELNGELNEIIDKTYFEAGVDCGHSATYTDDDGNVWSGMPLWFLVGYVDDDKKHGNNAFNDELAEQGYSIKVIAGDDYSINFQSAAVARNDNIIVANKLNGEPLPATIGEKNKPCFPLQLVGSDVSSGQKIGNIAKIELIGLPEPETEWSILLDGAFKRILTQSEFEEGVACGHAAAYTDADNNVWTGVPLWYILAIVDDINADNHWKFNDDRSDTGYTVTISAEDGYSKTFNSADIARNNNYILANKMNAAPISAENGYPLKLQGPDLTSGQRIGTIASIKLNGLPEEPMDGEWVLTLKGKLITATISQSLFEEVAAAHGETYDDGVSTWRGVPLWLLAALVDDDKMRGANSFNEDLAETGYTVIVSSGGASPYSKDFTSQDIAENKSNYIVANQVNGTAIPGNAFPLRLVGEGAPGSKSVGNIETIELTAFDVPTEAPTVRIVKYAADGVTVVNEVTKDYLWMKENLLVYGGEDGIRLRFQGPTFDPNDLWNPAETINPGKVDEVVRGTSIKDLCDLVGGAPENSEIILRASDGYEMKINDTNLNSPLERQGEAIIAWWTERQGYVPDYSDGYRLFFNAPDGVFGADDMRATLKEDYWHYYWSDGIQYPSAAGCSNKLISTIEIHTGAREDWSLILTGAISDTIARSYFESGKACTMGGHGFIYTDDDGNVWSGMPLWTLVGWVDDENKHDFGSDPYRDDLADEGYNVTVIDYGPDGIKGTEDDFSATFHSTFVKRNNNIIVANEVNGQTLPADGEKPTWPLQLVGSDITSGKQRVGSIDEIELTDLPVPVQGDATISLKAGWNFISVPKRLSNGNNTASIFSSVDTMDRSIWEYNSAVKLWKAMQMTDQIRPLAGYWIYSAGNQQIPLIFDTNPIQTPPTRELYKGWNAIGFSGTEPASARDTLLSLGDLWTQTIGFNAMDQQYETAIIRGGSGIYSDTTDMNPIKGYWIYLTAGGELASL